MGSHFQNNDLLCIVVEFDRLRELCVTKPLRGTMMSLQRVPQAQTIQVHNIGEVTEEILKLYFENKRSGGGEVTNAQFFRKDGYALFQLAECACKLHVSM